MKYILINQNGTPLSNFKGYWVDKSNELFSTGSVGIPRKYAQNEYTFILDIPSHGYKARSNVMEFTGSIDWGDGVKETYTNSSRPTHVYNAAGEYTVVHKGTTQSLNYSSILMGNDMFIGEHIIDVIWIGGAMGIKSMAGAFANVNGIMGDGMARTLITLRPGVLDNLKNVTDFSRCFDGSLFREIPEGLFDKCVNITNVSGCFQGCMVLESVPDKLFAKCTQITDFSNCFAGCYAIKTPCPTDSDGAPIYNRAGVKSTSCFNRCSKMTDYDSIPSNWK